jgi:photosystem II stability/assembly factor-like uncharacterized protein
MTHPLRDLLTGILSLVLAAAGPVASGRADGLPPELLRPLVARPIGPANMGGRITSLAVVESHPATFYVGAATGGLWKTTNAGTTWTAVFDQQGSGSIGAVAVAPSDPDVVWVGTGEANARNSVSWGDGVCRSTDGGKTWRHCGLRETHHIGRIVVDPHNPRIAYVAALGHLWGPNRQRGVFKTTDGGRHWEHTLALDDETGCADLALDPTDALTVFAAAYRVRRGPFLAGDPAVQFGPLAGLYRTRDGGKHWTRMTRGLPARPIGRCGLDVSRKEPGAVYAVVQTDRTNAVLVPGQAAAPGKDPATGGIFRSADHGDTWVKLNELCPRPFYFSQIRIDPRDPKTVYALGIPLYVSHDGGKNFTNDAAPDVHPDHHGLWIDPADSDHLILGNDGGLYVSWDRGRAWEHVRNLPLGQFYAAAVDLRRPYRVYGGLQDNGTWGGPSRTTSADGITTADWFSVMGADGFQCQVDPTDPDTVYAEGQNGLLLRLNVRTWQMTWIRPSPSGLLSPSYRFNWNSPLALSPHNPRKVYYGGNHVFASYDRGDHWETLSPDLTRGKPGSSPDEGHTITTLAESPARAGVLWAGTDDGRLHVSRNGAVSWTEVGTHIPNLPADGHFSRVECSPSAEGTAWVAVDRHRRDDRSPYVFRTDDYGQHWRPRVGGLPREGPVHVVRTSSRNPDLLFAGTEAGLYVTADGGDNWQPLRGGLPTVPVHDLVLHPRDRELVIATHGRSIYVLDVAPLEELTAAVRQKSAHLCEVRPVMAAQEDQGRGLTGGRSYVAANPPFGAFIYYMLRQPSTRPVKVVITDALGRGLAEMVGGKEAGLHRVVWNLRGGAGIGLQGARLVPPGDYVARLYVGDQPIMVRKVRVDPGE